MTSSPNVAFTDTNTFLVSYDNHNDTLSSFETCWSLGPLETRSSDFVLLHDSLAADFPCSDAQSYLYPAPDGNV